MRQKNAFLHIKLTEDWEFNVIGVYNYNKVGRFKPMFDYIRNNHNKIEGDIVDVGVFKAITTLGFAMYLKEIDSDKKVYGYDSFKGFPPSNNPKDEFERFEELFKAGRIDQSYWDAVRYYWDMIRFLRGGNNKLDQFSISTSGNFSNTSQEFILEKIDKLGLDNIELVDGLFCDSMKDGIGPEKVMIANLDCDLYDGHIDAFNFIWPRMSKGSYIWLDEYYSLKFPGARIATDEFLEGKTENPIMYPRNKGEFERWHVIKD